MAPLTVKSSDRVCRTPSRCFGYPTKAVWLACCAIPVVAAALRPERSVAIAAASYMVLSQRNNVGRKANERRPRVPWEAFAFSLNDREFRRRFRVNKELFEMVLQRIERDLRKDEAQAKRSSGSPITPAWRLAITLRMLAGGDACACADMAKISDKTVWSIVAETVPVMNRHFPFEDIDLKDAEKLKALEEKFARRSNYVMRGCVGAVDGMVYSQTEYS